MYENIHAVTTVLFRFEASSECCSGASGVASFPSADYMQTLGMSYLCNSMFIFKIHTQTLFQSQCMINSLSNLITSMQFTV